MKIFVTGATGFIGCRLAHALANQGHTVHALYRSKEKRSRLTHPRIVPFRGDILLPDTLHAAIAGCMQVYHTAALTDVWVQDPPRAHRFNVEGSRHVFDAALKAGAEVVMTSTAGVIGPAVDQLPVDENTPRQQPYFLDYEKTKAEAEALALRYADRGLCVRIVNPTRVYGPGVPGPGASLTALIDAYVRGAWRIMPGDGSPMSNYVYIDDVVQGHILAMERGKCAQRYILGGENCSYREFFHTLSVASGRSRLLIPVPFWLVTMAAHIVARIAPWLGRKPAIMPALARRYAFDWVASSNKAIRELGYAITPLAEGLRHTVDWLNENRTSK